MRPGGCIQRIYSDGMWGTMRHLQQLWFLDLLWQANQDNLVERSRKIHAEEAVLNQAIAGRGSTGVDTSQTEDELRALERHSQAAGAVDLAFQNWSAERSRINPRFQLELDLLKVDHRSADERRRAAHGRCLRPGISRAEQDLTLKRFNVPACDLVDDAEALLEPPAADVVRGPMETLVRQHGDTTAPAESRQGGCQSPRHQLSPGGDTAYRPRPPAAAGSPGPPAMAVSQATCSFRSTHTVPQDSEDSGSEALDTASDANDAMARPAPQSVTLAAQGSTAVLDLAVMSPPSVHKPVPGVQTRAMRRAGRRVPPA
ncbi:hypothetical protein WJX84_010002 [Apatococcus fuscideae]|uniref:Uncharacterized protein n=1 Tax=Apatococcus fuscideae TaxID=2026836 RepID=A0AAW1SM31_9CHLO